MKILAIDHSTNKAGWSLSSNSEFIKYGPLDFKGFKHPQIILAVYKTVYCLIEETQPDLVALEKPMALRNGDVARKLIEVYAACELAALHNNVEISEITPQLAKIYTAGHAAAEKVDVARALEAKYGLPFDEIAIPVYYKDKKRAGKLKERLFDVSDACAIAVAAWEIKQKELILGVNEPIQA